MTRNTNIGWWWVLVGVAVGLVYTPYAQAADFHVTTPQGLQTALSQAAANGDDDTIYLDAGYYLGNFNFNTTEGNNLTLKSEPGVTNSTVIIDGDANGGELNIEASSTMDVIVENVTFKRNTGGTVNNALRIDTQGDVGIRDCLFLGSGSAIGRGIRIEDAQDITIEDCTITCIDSAQGAGLQVIAAAGAVAITRNTVSGNNDRGVYIGGGAPVTLTQNTITYNSDNDHGKAVRSTRTLTLTGNTISHNSGSQIAVYVTASVTLIDNTISHNGGTAVQIDSDLTCTGNTITHNGGRGVYQYYSGRAVTISGNTVTHNGAGGLWLSSGGPFIDNVVTDNTGGYPGVRVYGSTTMRNNTITDNNSGSHTGAGVYLDYSGATHVITTNTITGNRTTGSAGGVYMNAANVTFTDNEVSDNSASGQGGAIYDLSTTGTAVYRRNTIMGNSSGSYGGGLRCRRDNLTLVNNLFAENGAGGQGGGLWLEISGTLNMVNNTVTDNSSSGGGGVRLKIVGTDEQINLYNNIIWGNTASGDGDDINLSGFGASKNLYHCDVHGLYGLWDFAVSNIDVAPLFVNALEDDYHLRSGSSCEDLGAAGAPLLPEIDLDWESRNTNAVDLGSFELANTGPHPADTNANWVIAEGEFTGYEAAWLNDLSWTNPPNPVPIDYVTRAGYLVESGGVYTNDGGSKPVCWKPNP